VLIVEGKPTDNDGMVRSGSDADGPGGSPGQFCSIFVQKRY
jgi:hypothetical protein